MTIYRVTCPNCQSSAEVPAAKVDSRKPLRCGSCQTAFLPQSAVVDEDAEVVPAASPETPPAGRFDTFVGSLIGLAAWLLAFFLPLAWFSLGSRSDPLVTIADHASFISFVAMVQLFFVIGIWWRSH